MAPSKRTTPKSIIVSRRFHQATIFNHTLTRGPPRVYHQYSRGGTTDSTLLEVPTQNIKTRDFRIFMIGDLDAVDSRKVSTLKRPCWGSAYQNSFFPQNDERTRTHHVLLVESGSQPVELKIGNGGDALQYTIGEAYEKTRPFDDTVTEFNPPSRSVTEIRIRFDASDLGPQDTTIPKPPEISTLKLGTCPQSPFWMDTAQLEFSQRGHSCKASINFRFVEQRPKVKGA